MARGEQLMRQWNLLRRLQTRGEGFPLRDLASEFGVSERTIQRDFEILEEIGFPIEHEEDEYGKRFWRLQHDFFRSGPLLLTLTEALSLQFASELFSPLAGTHYADAFDDIMAKIRRIVPKEALDHFAGLDRVVHVRRTGLTDFRSHHEVISRLDESLRQERSIEITYTALGRRTPSTTTFDPYGLIYYDGDLFALGYSHAAKARRIFKVSRIQAAELKDTTFGLPEDFDLEEEFRNSFGIFRTDARPTEVVVRFSGIGASLVEERTWHESQRHSWLPAGETLFDSEEPAADVLVATFRLSDFIEFTARAVAVQRRGCGQPEVADGDSVQHGGCETPDRR